MLSLIPSHTYDLEQLWQLIRNRNLWLIRIRYGAVVMMLTFILGSRYILNLKVGNSQLTLLLLITLAILVYNLGFFLFSNSKLINDDAGKFNPMHISLIQILLDLVILSFLTRYTGTIESPIYIFFIFHMIIGSLILPGWLIYTICGVLVSGFITTAFLEYFKIIEHKDFSGLFPFHLYNDFNYLILSVSSFAVMMVVSVFLANTISSALYRREQELEMAYDKLEEAERMKQKYTMGIVHEIKSPIVAVQSYLDIILGKYAGPVSEGVEEKLRRARTRTDESIQIINDILNISKLKLLNHLAKTDGDINSIIENTLDSRKASIENKKIQLSYLDKRYEKDKIQADPQLIELAVSNLIGNAIKYTNEFGVIEITLENELGRKIVFEVCDSGIGIPDNEKDKIFGDFFRTSNAKHQGFEGTGLGLTVVKQISEAHEGEISFRSPSRLATKTSPGTCFRLIVPIE